MPYALGLSVILIAGLAIQGSAMGQSYPRKAITMILPNAPGGAFDAAARPLAQALSQSLGQPVVVDNRPAASGIIGAQAAARATPDGHTILFTGSAQISLYPFLRKDLPYNPERDFAPVSRLGFLDSFLMVHASLQVNTLRELLDMARSKPEAVTFGTWGPTSAANMYIEWLKRARNIAFYAVPYKTAPQALNAGIAGEVQVIVFGQGQTVPLIKAGKLKALAATGTKRSPFLSQIPTLKETNTGFDLETPLWVGLFLPAGTAREIIQRLNNDVNALLADRNYTDKALTALGYLADEPGTPEFFSEFLKQDRKTYDDLVKLTGIKDE
ncbi:MAG: tripartite tricarboxylate transporter substrate binding protein [Betaproteobacteria bacterium]|nr:tripartite tricarboxylate transporter substrate binding protein [Betaproteobacteria bacterium]